MKNKSDLTFEEEREALELAQDLVGSFDRVAYERKMRELDREIIAVCNTKVWYNPAAYIPTDREKPYARVMLPAIRAEVKSE